MANLPLRAVYHALLEKRLKTSRHVFRSAVGSVVSCAALIASVGQSLPRTDEMNADDQSAMLCAGASSRSWIARHTVSGVKGRSKWRMPQGLRASMTALA